MALVALECARIVVKVFAFTKLRGINEDADNDAFGMLARQIHERNMPSVYVAHRRN